ncbi:MAG: hypothetical protein P1U38_08915 [Aeromicrobium sp.]|uniref:hypothetical protein n=1 Tax=Aeromicrobium sp. TaxID=1871063 RepID=UPI0026084782|nr:hypothetical protein [Aeromicrobium sp.]MDF1704883.1 hypothetical protein [Aeromicrobium sp.]
MRGWSRLTQAALTTHETLQFEDPSRIVERIAAATSALESAGRKREWPGPGSAHPLLAQAAAALRAAGRGPVPVTAEERARAEQALHSTLWVVANLVGDRADDHRIDLRIDRVPDSQHVQAAASDVHRRMKAMEQLAMEAALRIMPSSGYPKTASLAVALAHWDITAHRALLTERSTAVLHTVAHQEVAIAETFRGAIARARTDGVIDDVTADRLMPTLTSASHAWAEVNDVVADLSFGSSAPADAIISTSETLRGELAKTRNIAADPESSRELLTQFSGHLSTSLSIAAAARDLLEDQDLRAPARGVNNLLRSEESKTRAKPSVEPIDVYLGRSIELPPKIRLLLRDIIGQACEANSESLNRAAALDPLQRRFDPTSVTSPSSFLGAEPPKGSRETTLPR